jgi:polyphosphate kinase
MIKISRDAQLDIDSDLSKSMLEKISTKCKGQVNREPVRFIYDQLIEKDTRVFLRENENCFYR